MFIIEYKMTDFINMENMENDILKFPFLTAEMLHKAYIKMSEHDKEVLLFTITRKL